MSILTCKQSLECISLQIFSKWSNLKTNPPPDLPTLKPYPTPGVGGRFEMFSLKWRERMNLKVPGAILPLDTRFWAPWRKLLGVVATPFGELGLILTIAPQNREIIIGKSCLIFNTLKFNQLLRSTYSQTCTLQVENNHIFTGFWYCMMIR